MSSTFKKVQNALKFIYIVYRVANVEKKILKNTLHSEYTPEKSKGRTEGNIKYHERHILPK